MRQIEGWRQSLERFVSHGTEDLEPRIVPTLRRFSIYTLIAIIGAAYSAPFHLVVVGRGPVALFLVGVDVLAGLGFWLNRRLLLAKLTEARLHVAAHILMAMSCTFLTIAITVSGGVSSSILLYLAIAPITMSFLLGQRAGIVWGAIALVLIALEGTAPDAIGYVAPVTFPPTQAHLSLLAVLTALALASNRVAQREVAANEQLSVELETQNARLERQSISLAEALDRAEATSQSHQARFEAGFENSPIGIALMGPDAAILRANPALCSMFGHTAAELEGRRLTNFAHPDERRTDTAALSALATGEILTFERDERFVHQDGSIVWARLRAAAVLSPDGDFDGYFTQVEDITEHRRQADDLAYRATHDALTGLANRAMFLERVRGAIARLQGSHDRRGDDYDSEATEHIAVFFVDIDQFKILNDSLGHAMGDRLLVGVAERLRDALEDCDTVARFGGDEFAVLAEISSGSNDQARDVADRIHGALRTPFLLDGQALCATASIGIVVSGDTIADAADLLRHADTAMYRAKAEGRATSRMFDETMRESMSRRYELARQLGTALDSGEFRVHYQPEVDLGNGRIIGVEALLRWDHPAEGLLNAGVFIEIAEETGLIVPIGAWVLDQALRQAKAWPTLEDGHPLVTRINLSANQLTQDDFSKHVAELFANIGVDCDTVCFELTESALIATGAVAMANIDSIRTLGVRMAIDDFGTGYSSMTYLKQIPADALKIDLSFVQGLPTDERDQHIVASILELGRALGFEVVAEGVETEEQAEALRKLGCRRAQGYLWGRAVPADAILERLKEQALS